MPRALLALWQADGRSRQAACDAAMGALANDHAGTSWPVLATAMPILEYILRHGRPDAVASTICLLDDLFASFEAEPRKLVPATPAELDARTVAFQRAVTALRPLLVTLAADGRPSAQAARNLVALIDEPDD